MKTLIALSTLLIVTMIIACGGMPSDNQNQDRKVTKDEIDCDGLVYIRSSEKSKSGPPGTEILGTVINKRSTTLTYAQITFNLYDKSGAQIGTAMANINGLEPNGKWNFRAYSPTGAETSKFSTLIGH
jgi:hypothetical protein